MILQPQQLAAMLHKDCPVESSQGPSAAKGALPLQSFFHETRRRNEFPFISVLRGEEPLSCQEQGSVALNKGGVAAAKLPVLARREAGKEAAASPLARCKKTWVHEWRIMSSSTDIAVLLPAVPSLSPVHSDHSSACTSQTGQPLRAGLFSVGFPPPVSQ